MVPEGRFKVLRLRSSRFKSPLRMNFEGMNEDFTAEGNEVK